MKKVLVFLLACLASSVAFAATTHYQPNYQGCGSQFTKLIGVLVIDGVEQHNPNTEIGVFDQDGICRGACTPNHLVLPDQGIDRYTYNVRWRGVEGYSIMTLKVWDSENNVELDLELDIDIELGYYGNYTYQYNGANTGALNPYPINFHDPNAGGGIDKEITCYTGAKDNYYLISSPVGAVNPADVTNMVSPYAYDLYYFDQEQELEWINYKASAFNMIPGKGYLYANAGNGEDPTVTLTFPTTGTYDGDGVFPLDYVEGADFAGMNLVGNPYNATATVTVTDDPDCQFYVMNAAEGEVVSSEVSTVEPMQGIFVKATAPGKQVTFTVGETGDKVSKLSLNLLGNKGLVDRAIVNFGEGSLTKFQIHSNSTKLYIPVDGEDYAVVSSAEMGELPVNFEAKKSGSYTLAVSSELSFNYLHLIDNKTGADIDLLATPSYSFEAQTTDYASRFRLVFATGNGEDTFAFYSNGSFVINNEGEATVQVMDVTGRMLSSEAINGSASINVEGAAGVYMVRLVNGENVRVQKIIVK